MLRVGEWEALSSPDAPAAVGNAYSPLVITRTSLRAVGLVLSGQVALTPEGSFNNSTIEAEVNQIFDNARTLLGVAAARLGVPIDFRNIFKAELLCCTQEDDVNTPLSEVYRVASAAYLERLTQETGKVSVKPARTASGSVIPLPGLHAEITFTGMARLTLPAILKSYTSRNTSI